MKGLCLAMGLLSMTALGDCKLFHKDEGGSPDDAGVVDAAEPGDAAAGDAAPDALVPCDPNGVWTLDTPVEYQCCGAGSVSINIGYVQVSEDGATLKTSPFGETTVLSGSAVDCPGGSIDNAGSSYSPLCTIGTHITGTVTSANEWSGTVEVTFSSCGTCPSNYCQDQSFAVTAHR